MLRAVIADSAGGVKSKHERAWPMLRAVIADSAGGVKSKLRRYFTNRHAPRRAFFAAASNSASRARYCADVFPSGSGVRTP